MIFGKMDEAFIIGAKRTKTLKNIFFSFGPQITQITQIFFLFFIHKGTKGTKKIIRARRARTQDIVGGGAAFPIRHVWRIQKREMPNAGKGMREGENSGGERE